MQSVRRQDETIFFTMALLFILSVALIAFSTNVNYYAG